LGRRSCVSKSDQYRRFAQECVLCVPKTLSVLIGEGIT
jgi:hypothetical protein